MSERIRVLKIANNWGIGGTNLAFRIRIARLNPDFFQPMALGYESGGVFLDELAALGIQTGVCDLRIGEFERVLSEFRPHVIHWLRVTTVNPLIVEGQKLAKNYGVAAEVETNVFGRPALDRGLAPAGFVGHMSQTSLLRCAGQAKRPLRSLLAANHRAVYNPIPTAEFDRYRLEDRGRLAARSEHDIAPDQLLAVRVGRADLRKWSVVLELAIPKILEAVPNLVFAFLSAPPDRFEQLRQRCGDRVRLLPETSDPAVLARFYQASDLMIHSSAIGESFGCSLAEAMYWRKPVIVDTTPDMDNAQIEVVDHGETGFVVRSAAGFVEAARRLAGDPELRRRFGEAGHEKAMRNYTETVVVRVWEKRHIELLDRVRAPIIGDQHRDYAAAIPEIPVVNEAEYPAEYASRSRRTLGPEPGALERGHLAWRHAARTISFARQVGWRRVWQVAKDRLRAGRLFRRA